MNLVAVILTCWENKTYHCFLHSFREVKKCRTGIFLGNDGFGQLLVNVLTINLLIIRNKKWALLTNCLLWISGLRYLQFGCQLDPREYPYRSSEWVLQEDLLQKNFLPGYYSAPDFDHQLALEIVIF